MKRDSIKEWPNLVSKYVIFTYLLFWVMVFGICGTASMVFNASPLTMRWLANLCAWSPTIALLLMLKRLRPETTLKKFLYQLFSKRLRFDLLLLSTVAVEGAILISVMVLYLFQAKAFSSFFNLGVYSLPLSFLLSLLSGPTGEEAGWRGYLRVELNQKNGLIKGSLILGVVWTFWHAVLWFVDADFTGIELMIYIISNVVVMTSLTIIINSVMEKSPNLFNAIWLHLCFNFLYSFLVVDISFYLILSIVYAVVALGFLAGFNRKKVSQVNIENKNVFDIKARS